MLEDFWLPRREGGRGTEISTLPGGQNLGELTDVDYFQKKLYRSLNIPDTRVGGNDGFNPASMRFPTFRRNTSNLWSACKRRFLTPNEQATCMGYAVYPETALASSSHQDSFYGFSAQPLLGNAMHKANIGCITAIALSCCRLKSSHDGSIADHHGSIADL